MAISKSVLHIFYNSYSEDRPSLFGISSILPFFVDVKESIAGHSEISLITNFGYCKFWVKILPQSEKNLINFVKYVLILFIRICSYLTTPNGPPLFFFYLGWGRKISCKINALFTDQAPACVWKKVLQLPEAEWCANTSCQWHPMTKTLSCKFHKWTERLLHTDNTYVKGTLYTI